MKKEASPYVKKVIELALKIPKGRVTTYGIINRLAGGSPRMAQMITSILGRSDVADKIPFHRIIYSDGRVWTSPEYDTKRMKLYKAEGIKIDEKGKVIDFDQKLYLFE